MIVDLFGYLNRVSIPCGDQARERKRDAEGLAAAYARLENHYSSIEAKARDHVAEKAAATDAAAQSKINDAMMQSRHDITSLKQEANRRMAILQIKNAALMDQLGAKDAVIAAQAEQLTRMQELVARHGIAVVCEGRSSRPHGEQLATVAKTNLAGITEPKAPFGTYGVVRARPSAKAANSKRLPIRRADAEVGSRDL